MLRDEGGNSGAGSNVRSNARGSFEGRADEIFISDRLVLAFDRKNKMIFLQPATVSLLYNCARKMPCYILYSVFSSHSAPDFCHILFNIGRLHSKVSSNVHLAMNYRKF